MCGPTTARLMIAALFAITLHLSQFQLQVLRKYNRDFDEWQQRIRHDDLASISLLHTRSSAEDDEPIGLPQEQHQQESPQPQEQKETETKQHQKEKRLQQQKDDEDLQPQAREDRFTTTQKGQLWIHVGPPKTGTTTLQDELKSIEKDLNDDGYQYTKGIFRDDLYFLDSTCQLALAEARLVSEQQRRIQTENSENSPKENTKNGMETATATVTETRSRNIQDHGGLYDILTNIPCWKARLDQLEAWRLQGKRHVIVSNEGIGFRWIKIPMLGDKPTTNNRVEVMLPADWVSVQLTLEPWYDVHIVIGYRRYFEWLISSKYHEDRFNPKRPHRSSWPRPKKPLKSSSSSFRLAGKELIPVYPDLLGRRRQQQRQLPFYYTDEIRDRFQPYFAPDRIHILNMHDTDPHRSILTLLICHIVTNAPHACQRSRIQAKMQWTLQQQHYKANVRSDGIIDEIFYDMIITKAAKLGFFPTEGVRRRHVVLRAKEYHQVTMNQTRTDLPLKCPSIEEATPLLALSLALERELLWPTAPTTVASSSFYNSSLTQEAFSTFLEKKMLCTVDVENCLREKSIWQNFFAMLKQ